MTEVICFYHNSKRNETTVWEVSEADFCQATGIHGGRVFDRPRLPLMGFDKYRLNRMAEWLVANGIEGQKHSLSHPEWGHVIRIVLDRQIALNFVPDVDGEPIPLVTTASRIWPKGDDGLPRSHPIGVLELSREKETA